MTETSVPRNELERVLISDGAFTSPLHIVEGISDTLAHKKMPGAPHTIYAELWHITYWQQITLDWVHGIETPNPMSASLGFPSDADIIRDTWLELCERFSHDVRQAGDAAADASRLETPIRCPSPAGQPARTMTVREQLENLAAHNAYHFGRIVLLRQLNGVWPPASGGFTW